MTTAAEKVAGPAEKVEKRRALGRGLESLLPGPRVVTSPGSRAASPDTAYVGEAAGETKAPRFARDDSRSESSSAKEMEASRTGTSDPHDQTPYQDAAYAAGQPRAAVPTLNSTDGDGHQEGEVISIQAVAEDRGSASVVSDLPMSLIDKNPYQTRFVFDDDMLQELQDSIRQHGVVQPIVVRPGEGWALHPSAGRAAIAGFEDCGAGDDSGIGAPAFTATGGGDDGARECGARGPESD